MSFLAWVVIAWVLSSFLLFGTTFALYAAVFKLKELHVGVEADLYTDGDAYAGAHVEYQF